MNPKSGSDRGQAISHWHQFQLYEAKWGFQVLVVKHSSTTLFWARFMWRGVGWGNWNPPCSGCLQKLDLRWLLRMWLLYWTSTTSTYEWSVLQANLTTLVHLWRKPLNGPVKTPLIGCLSQLPLPYKMTPPQCRMNGVKLSAAENLPEHCRTCRDQMLQRRDQLLAISWQGALIVA